MDAEIINEPKTYRIPEVNYGAFQQRTLRLQRRAAKLNSGVITITEIGTEDWPGYYNLKNTYLGDTRGAEVAYFPPDRVVPRENFEPTGFYRRYHLIQVSGDAPKLNGWEFVGSLELIIDEDGKTLGQMVRTVPGKEIPVEFRDAKVWCSHCNANRRWHSTFIVKHEDGTYKQVGRNCLRDFTGHLTPEAIANMAEILLDLSDLADCAEDDDWGFGGGGSGTRYYDVETLLVNTSAIVRRDGWKPKSFEHEATAAALTARVIAYKSDEVEWWEKNYPVEAIDRTTAEQALEFMVGLADKPNASDYEYNLSLLGRAGKVPMKSFGFVASAIPAFMRANDRAMAQKREATVSQYVGAVKERMEMTLTLSRVTYIDTSYGSMGIMKFYDENNNVIIWKTGSDPQIEVGTTMRVKATVAKHEEWKPRNNPDAMPVKQTEVKRLTVIETVSPTKQEEAVAV